MAELSKNYSACSDAITNQLKGTRNEVYVRFGLNLII